jgi:hypothetical protein
VLRPGTPVTRLTLTPPAGWRITDLTMAGWQPEQIGGYEVVLRNVEKPEASSDLIFPMLPELMFNKTLEMFLGFLPIGVKAHPKRKM